jgi:hypothetical protein
MNVTQRSIHPQVFISLITTVCYSLYQRCKHCVLTSPHRFISTPAIIRSIQLPQIILAAYTSLHLTSLRHYILTCAPLPGLTECQERRYVVKPSEIDHIINTNHLGAHTKIENKHYPKNTKRITVDFHQLLILLANRSAGSSFRH